MICFVYVECARCARNILYHTENNVRNDTTIPTQNTHHLYSLYRAPNKT